MQRARSGTDRTKADRDPWFYANDDNLDDHDSDEDTGDYTGGILYLAKRIEPNLKKKSPAKYKIAEFKIWPGVNSKKCRRQI